MVHGQTVRRDLVCVPSGRARQLGTMCGVISHCLEPKHGLGVPPPPNPLPSRGDEERVGAFELLQHM